MKKDLEVKFLKNDEEIKDWDNFVAVNQLGSVHQISKWGEFQSKSSFRDKFWIIAVFEGEKIVGGSLVIRQKLPFGKCWFYLPRGPVVDLSGGEAQNILENFFNELKALARAEKAIWIRIDPEISLEKNLKGIISRDKVKVDWGKLGFKKAHAHYQPENTLMLNLEMNEEEILRQMKPKGRYNIKVAEKKSVQVREGEGERDVKVFYKLLNETTARDQFSGHDLKYYREMLEILGPEFCKLYLAEFAEAGESMRVIAGIIVTFFGEEAIYYFGASANLYRNMMAPYLLQWTAIKEARRRGIKRYDFLGVAPAPNNRGGLRSEGAGSKHAWAGVTEFKLKFGGTRVDFWPAQEIILKPGWMLLIRLLKALKR